MTMSQYVGYGFKRISLVDHTGGKTVAECMSAPAGHMNTRGTDITLYD